ncbi:MULTISPECIES: adenosylcobalamin-dependent ribonucleoside-diphosphate reductase [Thermus]|uniref:Vitamin B12-dependent ribonucleotide reductase n=1 Tax=Thermus brockianus TaxID=56956 RepID=A0A1J0LSE1_THEBO|nr:adenosylcobalamin-dependent ribonucleoside-diphosphate reductase [Thermus brockianus]APD08940.1 ribonucleoside-diphosphate reductase [Thermus brockianus]BDG15631.1 hypothetical protein TbrSNM41_03650 [Thermus brockianus]
MERYFFDEHAQAIAKRQYLQPGDGDILGMFRRVAREMAKVERPEERAHWEEKFYELMATKRFSPGGRILAGAGTAHGNLLNCFVQGATENPPESFAGIMEVAKKLALVTKVGGGNGVNLDPYRSKGGRRRRPVQGVAYLAASHPDVEDFIRGLMRPPINPDGPKEEIALKNFARVVYGEASPELKALAERYGVALAQEPPEDAIRVPDDMGGIVDAAREAADRARRGLVAHVDFSLLRPEGAPIRGSGGTSSGPVSFLFEIFDNFLEWAAWGAEVAGPVATLRYVYAPVLRVVRQGGCLHPDTLVHTDRGTLRLRELVDPFRRGWQPHTLSVATDEGWRPSPEGYNNGVASTLRVVLENGLEVQGTPNHKLKVLREDGTRAWVELQALKPGDWVIWVLDEHTGTPVQLAPLDEPLHPNATPIRTPEVLTEDLAFLLGFFFGEGFVSGDRIGFSVHEEEPMKEEIKGLFRKLFGLELREERKPADRSLTLVVHSRPLVTWLRKNGLLKGKARELEVPRAIRQSPRPVLAAFLRGLFEADGTVTAGYPMLTTASRRLAQDVMVLLGGLGIPSKLLRYNPLPGRFSKAEHYRVRVVTAKGLERYLERIGVPQGSRLQVLYQSQPDTRRESSWPLPHAQGLLGPLLAVAAKGRKGHASPYTSLRKDLLRYLRGERQLTATGYALVQEKAQGLGLEAEYFAYNEYYVRVAAVEPAGEILTLDLSVEGNHTYLANGLVSHNTRRGAGMATLAIEHPDLLDFLTAKDLDREKAEGDISTFNISVLVSDAFMRALEEDALWPVTPIEVPGKYYPYPLEGPYTGKLPELPEREDGAKAIPLFGGKVPARWLWHEIAWHAWATGEPGLIFVDRINALSALKGLGERFWIRSTNPCGEIPLTVGEPCDLGALNLAAYVKDGEFQMEAFRQDVRTAIRFLDNVLDVNQFALKDNEEAAKRLRRLGLGVMGLADMLIRLGLPYDSEAAREKVYEIISAMREEAIKASEALAEERGPFPLYKAHADYFQALGIRPRRNVAVLTVAPTGTTSMLMGVSSGIEPVFSPFVWRRIGGEYKPLLHPLFVELMEGYPPAPGYEKDGKWDWDKIIEEIQRDGHGSVQSLPFVPEPIRQVFRCAHDIHPLDHVRMQGVVQRAFDAEGYAANSLSKCIAKGTLIPTSKGLIPVEEIAPPHPEDTFAPVDGLYTAEGYRITAHYFAGKKRGVRVRLDNGAELVGAWESHRILTPQGWRLMRELKPGDLVLGKLVPAHGPGGAPISLEFPLRTNAKVLPLPERMSPELALFLGMLAADGSTVESTGFVGIATKSPEVEAAFRDVVQRLFGAEPKVTVDKRTGVRNLYLTSRRLTRYVEALIGKGAAEKRVPRQILQGNAEEKLAFLKGLTLDGYARPDLGLVVYEGKSARLAYEAAEMARSFGLPQVYQGRKKVEAPKGTYFVHSLVVSGPLQELVEPIEVHKRIPRVDRQYRVFVPEEVVEATRVGVRHPGYANLKSVRSRGVSHVYNRTADRLGWPTEVLAFRVVEVEDVGEVEMYDIEVEEVHRYVVNGILSHNTINLPHEATVADVEAAYAEAYRTGCKGITVYRDGSREFQVLTVKKEAKEAKGEQKEKAPEGEPWVAQAKEPQAQERPGGPVYERPGRLMGFTDMVKLLTPEGAKRSFLVTVNLLGDRPIEVILTSGKAGDEANADSEALGRVVSIALQYGVPPEAIVRTLRGINGGLYGTYQGRLVSSKADLIAVALETIPQAFKKGLPPEEAQEPLPSLSGGGLALPGALACPVCGEKALVREEGCYKCQACGYSKCG